MLAQFAALGERLDAAASPAAVAVDIDEAENELLLGPRLPHLGSIAKWMAAEMVETRPARRKSQEIAIAFAEKKPKSTWGYREHSEVGLVELINK